MPADAEGTASRLDALAIRIAARLDADFDRTAGFAGTEFYATAFACWLWRHWPERHGAALAAGLARIRDQDKTAPIGSWRNPFHWEFVRFALAGVFRDGPVAGHAGMAAILPTRRFVGNRTANWTLLRSTARLAEGGPMQRRLAAFERGLALRLYQRPDGLIEDRRGEPSQQYHCFAAALLGYQLAALGLADDDAKRRLARALAWIADTALEDGEVNAVGRGRFQSFGYASAVLALATGLALGVAPPDAWPLVRAVVRRLERAEAGTGRLPLMLNGADAEPLDAALVRHPHQRRLGWHSYNNAADYHAFSGALLKLSASLLAPLDETEPEPAGRLTDIDRLTDDFRVVRRMAYGAVVAPPRRALTSSQPLPYLVTGEGGRPLPAYGGENLPDSIYSALGLPLPVFETGTGRLASILERADFRWAGRDRLVGEAAGFRFERRFVFAERRIEIEDRLLLGPAYDGKAASLWFPWLPLPEATTPDGPAPSARFRLDRAWLDSETPLLRLDRREYSPSGPLAVWAARQPALGAGEEFSSRIVLALDAVDDQRQVG